MALSGATKEQGPPPWYSTLAAAEAWGVTPWQVEEEAPAVWVDRFVAVANERAAEQERNSKKSAKGGTGRRLM